MKIKSALALPLLLATSTVVLGSSSSSSNTLLRGNRDTDVVEETIPADVVAARMGKVPIALMGDEGRHLVTRVAPTEEAAAPAAPAPKKATTPVAQPAPAVKKPAPKVAAADDEEEEAAVVGGNANDNDNTLDYDAELGVKPTGNKPKVVDQIGAPKKAQPAQVKKPAPAPAQQVVDDDDDEEEEEETPAPAKPVTKPVAPAQPAQVKKPAPVQQVVDDDEEEEDAPVAVKPKKAGAAPTEKWWDADPDQGQTPANAAGTGDLITLTVRPNENAVRINSRDTFTGGRFEVKLKSASVMPGVVTAIYLASGKGRTGDGDGGLGDQDEIDFEFKGNDPNRVQTNVFVSGKEDLLLVDVGENTSDAAHNYVIEWDDKAVNFMIDGKNVRSKNIDRPLKPMSLHMSVWTTVGGWPGVKAWAGDANWDQNGNKDIVTTLEVISLPNAAK